MSRGIALLTGLLATVPAMAGEMNAEEAHRFVIGKIFTYTCFEGTRGQRRVLPDGSVIGSIHFGGSGQVRYANLPPGTLGGMGETVCASVRGLPVHPCFILTRINDNSFRGSISGLGFASCEFTGDNERATVAQSAQPLGLRPSLTANNN